MTHITIGAAKVKDKRGKLYRVQLRRARNPKPGTAHVLIECPLCRFPNGTSFQTYAPRGIAIHQLREHLNSEHFGATIRDLATETTEQS